MVRNNHLIKDVYLLAFSILASYLIIKFGIVEDLLIRAAGIEFLGSFIAGFFFTNSSTIIPAMVVLGKITQYQPILTVAVLGAAGAVIGDLIIFKFIRDRLADDLVYLLRLSHHERWLAIFHRRLFRRLIPFLGALVIISPLPDELGIAMMGLSRMKTLMFVPLSFGLNFIGIVIVGIISRSLL